MQKQTLYIVLALILIVGFGGYTIGKNTAVTSPVAGTHLMPDGSVMNDDGSNMAGMMMDMNAALRGKTGDALDKAFLEEMIIHHEGAVEMTEILLQGTTRPELLKLGTDIVTAQTAEIEMMKQWKKEWFGR